MKIQFITTPDAAMKIRAHVAMNDGSVLVLKYDEKDFSKDRVLFDACIIGIQRMTPVPEVEVDEIQQTIDRVGVDAIKVSLPKVG